MTPTVAWSVSMMTNLMISIVMTMRSGYAVLRPVKDEHKKHSRKLQKNLYI